MTAADYKGRNEGNVLKSALIVFKLCEIILMNFTL